jgi:hypothetical protein
MQISRHFLRRTILALSVVLAPAAVLAAQPSGSSDAEANYKSEVARCKSGMSGQDQATCLREAGAARQQAMQGGLTSTGGYDQNAIARCQRLPADQRQNCISLMNSPAQTQGSVEGGGMLRQKTITVPAQ